MVLLWSFASVLALGLQSVQAAGVIDCYGYGGRTYSNNTKCPGSNACCDVNADCLSNLLCHNPKDGDDTFIRGPCAVEGYDSGTCAQICLYDEVNSRLPRVRTCGNGSLCCDNDPQCCDSGGDGVFLDNKGRIADSAPSTTFTYGPERTAATFRTDRTTSTPATSTSEPSTTTGASQETNTAGKDDSDDGGNDNAVKIGVGVAVPVAVLLIAAAGFFFWRRRKAKSAPATAAGDYTYGGIPKPNPHEVQDTPSPSMNQGYGGTQAPPQQYQPHVELDNTQRQYNELAA